MTKKTSKILSDEHKYILKVIEALEKEADNIQSGKIPNEEFLRKAISFIRNYADKFHHAKEEDILFTKMCINENLHCNPIPQMLSEHEQGRSFVKGIEQGITERNRKKIVENALGYINLLREHIFKEDNILYPMADDALNDETEKEMLKEFEKINKEKKKEVEEFIKFANNLK